MPIQSFRRLQFRDTILNRFQDAVKRVFDDIRRREIIDGILLEDKDLSTSETRIEHTLGRVPQGWIIVDQDASADIYRSSDSTSSFLPLTASASVTVSIWVF